MTHEAVSILEDLIRYESISPLDVGCQKVLIAYLTDLGFSISQHPCENADNFWAHKGRRGPLFCFAGHTDVVPTGPLDEWNTDPFVPTIIDGKLFGRGSADMKGALAAMLVATKRFLNEKPDYHGQLGFLITSAEEGPSDLGTPIVLDALSKQNIKLDYCLVGEPTAIHRTGDMIKYGRRGSLSGRCYIHGKQGHIAYPHLADNPIHRSFAALQQLTTTSWDTGNAHFQPTSLQISNIHAGTGAGNVIPGEVIINFNFRYSPMITHDDLISQTEAIFTEHGLNFTIDWNHSGKPFITASGKLIDVTKNAIQKICGLEPELSTTGGTSDGRFIADFCPEIIECGVNNSTIHQINEHTVISDLVQLTDVYFEILCHIFER